MSQIYGGCDCLIEEDVKELDGRGKEYQRVNTGNISVQIPDYVSLQQESIKKSPFETFNNDNDKSIESFNNLKNMIRLYTKALKNSLSQTGSREILDDVYFLTLDHNENKMRSLFIKWREESNGLIDSLSSQTVKSQLRNISSQMQNYSYRIMNQQIPDYKIYMQDVDIAINQYKKTIKTSTMQVEHQTDEVKRTIDTLLEATNDKSVIINEFEQYDDKLFERLDLHMRQTVTESSEEMQGYRRFRTLRKQTVKNFINALQQYEGYVKQDISKFKNHRPSKQEYDKLMSMYKGLNDVLINNESVDGPHSVNDLVDIYKNPAPERFYQIMRQGLGDKDGVQMIIADSIDIPKTDTNKKYNTVKFSRRNIDELYTKAATSIVALMNNYEFMLRYCNAISQMGIQFSGTNIQNVISDVIINYYLLLFFSPGKNCIFIRQLDYVVGEVNDDKFIEDDYYNTIGKNTTIINTDQLNSIQAAIDKIEAVKTAVQALPTDADGFRQAGDAITAANSAIDTANTAITAATLTKNITLRITNVNSIQTILNQVNEAKEAAVKQQQTYIQQNNQIKNTFTDYPRNAQEDETMKYNQITPWKQLTRDNAEYKYYNVLSNMTFNCIKALYGTFNLLIEYYLKPEKSLSQLISGGAKQDGTGQLQPITEALPFYKLIKKVNEDFDTQFKENLAESKMQDSNKNIDIFSKMQFYTSSKFYDLWMYFKHQQNDLNKYLEICNKLWNSYNDNTQGIISQRCKRILQDYVKELLQSLVSQIYLGETAQKTDLDQMSYVYDDIRKGENSLYTTSIYTDNSMRQQMQLPEYQPIRQKDELIDSYMAISKVIDKFVENQVQDMTQWDKDLRLMDKDYKNSIIDFFQDMVDKYNKVKRPEIKYLLFTQYMETGFDLSVQTKLSGQIKFIKKLGVALNQYTVWVGEAIKLLILYHKTYVELDNFTDKVGKILKYKLTVDSKTSSQQINIYKIFDQYLKQLKIPNTHVLFKLQQEVNKPLKDTETTKTLYDLDKMEQDLLNGDVFYTYILQKLFQLLEISTTNGYVGVLVDDMIKNNLIQQFTVGSTHNEGNIPFTISQDNVSPPFYIMKEDIFHYLQTHLPYLKYGYYTSYEQFTKSVELLTKIPGIKFINGQMNTNDFFKQLESKKQYVIKQFEEFKGLKYDSETYNYIRKHLEQGLQYGKFFENTFNKYCPGPLPLNTWISANIKVYKFDQLDWSYQFGDTLNQQDGKIKITYKEDQTDRDLMVNVYSPFPDQNSVSLDKQPGITYNKKDNNVNIQLDVVDELNYYLDATTQIVRNQVGVLPQDYIDTLSKNSTIQQALITTPIEYNGSVFNLPLNALQTPFQCPSILGVQDTEQLTGLLNDVVIDNEVDKRLSEEGCFFTTDTLEVFMLLTIGAKTRADLTPQIRRQFRNELNKMCKKDVKEEGYTMKQVFDNVQKQYNIVIKYKSNKVLDYTDIIKDKFAECVSKLQSYLTTPGTLGQAMYYGADNFYDFDSMQKITKYTQWDVIWVKVNNQNKSKILQYIKNSLNSVYNVNPLALIYSLTDNYLAKSNLPQQLNNITKPLNVLNNYNLTMDYIRQINIVNGSTTIQDSQKSSKYQEIVTNYIKVLGKVSDVNENTSIQVNDTFSIKIINVQIDNTSTLYQAGKMQQLNSDQAQQALFLISLQYNIGDVSNNNGTIQQSSYDTAIINQIKGQAVINNPTSPQQAFDEFVAQIIRGINDLKIDSIIPIVQVTDDGKRTDKDKGQTQVNLVKSSKFAALSEALKKQYMKQVNNISVKLIYNKENKQMRVYREFDSAYNSLWSDNNKDIDNKTNKNNKMAFKDSSNPLIYMSFATMLQDGQQVSYSEQQKYNMIFNLVKVKRSLKQYQNRIQGLQLSQMSAIQGIISTLSQAIDQQINKCKDILRKEGIDQQSYVNTQSWNQYMYDPVQFIIYQKEQDKIIDREDQYLNNFIKLYIQYILNDKFDIGIDFQVIQNWFQINTMYNAEGVYNKKEDGNIIIKFNSMFNIFQRAAFIKRRVPNRQVIGVDHYWINKENLIFQKNQPKYMQYNQNSRRGWFYDLQKNIVENNYSQVNNQYNLITDKLWYYEGSAPQVVGGQDNGIIQVSNLKLINISDNPEYSNLFQFNYAFIGDEDTYTSDKYYADTNEFKDDKKNNLETINEMMYYKTQSEYKKNIQLNSIILVDTSNNTYNISDLKYYNSKNIVDIELTINGNNYKIGIIKLSKDLPEGSYLREGKYYVMDGTKPVQITFDQIISAIRQTISFKGFGKLHGGDKDDWSQKLRTLYQNNDYWNTTTGKLNIGEDDVKNIIDNNITNDTILSQTKLYKTSLNSIIDQYYKDFKVVNLTKPDLMQMFNYRLQQGKTIETPYVNSDWKQDKIPFGMEDKIIDVKSLDGKITQYKSDVNTLQTKNNTLQTTINSIQKIIDNKSNFDASGKIINNNYGNIFGTADTATQFKDTEFKNKIPDIIDGILNTQIQNMTKDDLSQIIKLCQNQIENNQKLISQKYATLEENLETGQLYRNTNQQISSTISKQDTNKILLSPLAIMQEITFFAGITNPETLNLGRDIYEFNSPIDEVSNILGNQQNNMNITFYKDTYKLLLQDSNIPRIIDEVKYDKDRRDEYLTNSKGEVLKTADWLIVKPSMYLYQILTRDYRWLDGQKFNADRVYKLIFQMLGIEPFNPIQLIKKNMPFPVSQALSIYIQVYEHRYLGPLERGFGADNTNVIKLNQTYKGKPIYILCDNRNRPLISDTSYNDGKSLETPVPSGTHGDNTIFIDTSSGQDIMYIVDIAKSDQRYQSNPDLITLQAIKDKQVFATKSFVPDIIEDTQVYQGYDGYYLNNLNGKKTYVIYNNTNSYQTNMLQNLMTIIPRYFYENSRILVNPLNSTTNIYEQNVNGEVIRKRQDVNTFGEKYLW